MSTRSFRTALQISDRFLNAGYPNGGYLGALAVPVFSEQLAHRDLLTFTGHYLSTARAGEAELAGELIGSTRSLSYVRATLSQQGEIKAQFVASFTDFARAANATRAFAEPTPRAAAEQCVGLRTLPFSAALGSLYESVKVSVRSGQLTEPGPAQAAELEGYIELADASTPSLSSLVLFADAFPPPLFNQIPSDQWASVPTIELSVHCQGRPSAGPVHAHFWARSLIAGALEIDGELHDAAGKLVARSRQMARYRGQ